MNQTPRLLNRLILGLAGLLLLALGAAAIALAVAPAIREAWSRPADDALTGLGGFWANAAESTPGHSVWWLAVIATAVLLIVLAIIVVTRQGRGRTGRLLARDGTDLPGTVDLSVGVAEQALTEALASRPEIVSVNVAGYRVGADTQLRIAVSPRPGAAPDEIADLVEARLRDWDALLGTELPALISLTTGIRSRGSGVQRAN